jgi:hypothetical protein
VTLGRTVFDSKNLPLEIAELTQSDMNRNPNVRHDSRGLGGVAIEERQASKQRYTPCLRPTSGGRREGRFRLRWRTNHLSGDP